MDTIFLGSEQYNSIFQKYQLYLRKIDIIIESTKLSYKTG